LEKPAIQIVLGAKGGRQLAALDAGQSGNAYFARRDGDPTDLPHRRRLVQVALPRGIGFQGGGEKAGREESGREKGGREEDEIKVGKRKSRNQKNR
jgi:hypothetical protein